MIVNKIIEFVLAVALAAGCTGGCKCQRDVAVDDKGPVIDRPSIAKKDPKANRPNINFPRDCRTDDITLNQFVDRALNVCNEGDYDGFRELFGTDFTPTGQKDFENVWHGVKEVTIARVEKHPSRDPPEYYVHAVVLLREPDRKGRAKRDVVVVVFQEAGQWRLRPAPKEIGDALVSASSQPASGPVGGE